VLLAVGHSEIQMHYVAIRPKEDDHLPFSRSKSENPRAMQFVAKLDAAAAAGQDDPLWKAIETYNEEQTKKKAAESKLTWHQVAQQSP
jgi:hypothetical protein